MFRSIHELVSLAEENNQSIAELMLEQEAAESGRSQEAIWADMRLRFEVMRRAVEEGVKGVRSHSGMTGGDAQRLYEYLARGHFLTDSCLIRALCYAVATNEVNASMGIICATPTAGSSGILPGVLFALQERFSLPDDTIIRALFTAGAIGFVIANNASVSGAAGGCQAEVGSASAMAAAAAVELNGGTPHQAAHAMAIALKNMLGLTCDPLAGLVEVPCIKRNAGGVANALSAAEMALAGLESKVPWDEVISAMHNIGLAMPESLRERSTGGLAATETGKRWFKELQTAAPSTM